jgi:hypothetical protein
MQLVDAHGLLLVVKAVGRRTTTALTAGLVRVTSLAIDPVYPAQISWQKPLDRKQLSFYIDRLVNRGNLVYRRSADTDENLKNEANQMATRLQKAQQVTWIGFLVNFLLVISKLFAGFVGKSAAMIADGVHSLSDFITDIIVLVFMRVSDKGSDSIIDMDTGNMKLSPPC